MENNQKVPAKNVSFRKRFAGREAELTEKIKMLGTSPVAREEGVTEYAMRNYAEAPPPRGLGMVNPQYVTQSVIADLPVVARSFVGALFEIFTEQKAEIAKLRQEKAEWQQSEEKQQMAAKLQLMQLMEAVKKPSPRRAILSEVR